MFSLPKILKNNFYEKIHLICRDGFFCKLFFNCNDEWKKNESRDCRGGEIIITFSHASLVFFNLLHTMLKNYLLSYYQYFMQHRLITTSIPYLNAGPHIGFAMELTISDILVRYNRAQGNDTIFPHGSR